MSGKTLACNLTEDALEQLIRADKEMPDDDLLETLLSGQADDALFSLANAQTIRTFGKVVDIRAIIEFSNHCWRRCSYCGLNCTNTPLARYRMQESEIVATAQEAWHAGYRTVVLQSGEDRHFTKERICKLVNQIKATTGLAITLSIGERPYEELVAFHKAGADRYLLKHETADDQRYQRLHPDATLETRITCLKQIKQLGYECGSGFMVGLPGQPPRLLVKDLRLLQSLCCDMAGIGPFIPHPETPLGQQKAGEPILAIRAVALARLLLPKANLPATTSLGVLNGKARDTVFSTGANVIMRKVTPWNYRRMYEIYPTDFGLELGVKEARIALEDYVRSLDRIPR